MKLCRSTTSRACLYRLSLRSSRTIRLSSYFCTTRPSSFHFLIATTALRFAYTRANIRRPSVSLPPPPPGALSLAFLEAASFPFLDRGSFAGAAATAAFVENRCAAATETRTIRRSIFTNREKLVCSNVSTNR